MAAPAKKHDLSDPMRHLGLLKKSGLFHADWYCATYPDVDLTELSPEEHFLRYGAMMGRDPGPGFNSRLYLERHGDEMAPGQSALVHHLNTDAGARTTKPLPISVSRKKLWGGFSAQGLTELRAMLDDPNRAAKTRGEAAILLARWAAGQGHAGDAVQLLEQAMEITPALANSRRPVLLLVEALMQSGQPTRARALIDQWDTQGGGDFVCARNNLEIHQGGAGAHRARVEMLNRHFTAHGLTPIALENPAAGLVFGNIRFDPPQRPVDGPKVSILVPVYDAGEFIDVAMNALLTQTWQNLEIIAIEDRGPDDSWDRLQAFAARDSRVKVLRNDENMGAYPTRNRALHLATGDFITVHDSDDWSHPQMIEKQVQALQADATIRATCSMMVRVTPQMYFIQRPQRDNPEYLHRSYPSLMMRRADLDVLGEWDSVSANADSEMMHRIRVMWGEDALIDVVPNVPLSFFLVHEKSLTQQAGTNLNSVSFGIRREYNRHAAHWREKQAQTAQPDWKLARTSMNVPFPIPQGLAPRNWPRDFSYDIMLVSDLSRTGTVLASNLAYLRATTKMGLRVGLFHWPRADLRMGDVLGPYLERCYQHNIDLLVPEDTVTCDLVLVSHTGILDHDIDGVPTITARKVAVTADILNEDRWAGSAFAADHAVRVSDKCRTHFGTTPVWHAVGARAQRLMQTLDTSAECADEVWYPALPKLHPVKGRSPGSDGIVLGGHGGDPQLYWPEQKNDFKQAYCAEAKDIAVQFEQGAEPVMAKMKNPPSNWTAAAMGRPFYRELDFYAAFGNENQIQPLFVESLLAMGHGVVVIAAPRDRDLYGDAAVYAAPEAVEGTMRALWANPPAYEAQAARSLAYVEAHCSDRTVRAQLGALLGAAGSGRKR